MKSLFVGINKYKGSPLYGCVNDAVDFSLLCQHNGQPPADQRILLDEFATHDSILHELDWLKANTADGEVALFCYSGHGSQVPATGSDLEYDRMDETICPYDYQSCDPFTDDVLRVALSGWPNKAIQIIVLDCCHSGTGTRGEERAKGITTEVKMPVVGPNNLFGIPQDRGGQLSAARMKHILYAACRSDEYAMDALIDGRQNGAFTHSLLKSIREGGSGKLTPVDVLRQARLTLKAGRFQQHPQLEGPSRLKANPAAVPGASGPPHPVQG